MEEQSKKPWQSLTVWTNLAVAAAAFWPAAQQFLVENPALVGMLFSGVNILLRVFKTKSEIKLLK